MPTNLAIIALYLFVQIAIGIWVSRSVKTEADFLLGGRSLGMFLSTFTIFATWFGAEASIGSAGNVYMEGITGARIEPFGYTIALLLCALLLGQKLREKSYMTLADFFADRFGTKIEKLAVFILVPSTLTWTAAQILAFGHLLNGVVDLPLTYCLGLAVLVVVIYCSFGGFMGSVYTDVLQAFVLIAGMLALLIYALPYIKDHPFELLSRTPIKPAVDSSILTRLDSWAVPILGSMTSQEMISRLLAAKSPQVAKWSSILAALFYLLLGLIPVYLGLYGYAFPVEVQDGDQYLPSLAKLLLPGTMYLLFSAAMISAILSTADSSIITVTGLVTHNLLHAWGATEQKKVWLNRIVVLLCGAVIFGMSLKADKIYDLLLLASSLGTAGILILILLGLWTSLGSPRSALTCLITGLVAPPVLSWLEMDAPFLGAIGLCFGVFLMTDILWPTNQSSG
jgi:SSS family solute:Na+ symporter